MRGKIARAIRKEINFDPNAKREYVEHELTRVRSIMSYNVEKKRVDIVKRPVSVFITECTDGARNFYQYLKRKYTNPDYVKELNELPSVDELTKLAHDILGDTEVVDDLKKKNKTLDQLQAESSAINQTEE